MMRDKGHLLRGVEFGGCRGTISSGDLRAVMRTLLALELNKGSESKMVYTALLVAVALAVLTERGIASVREWEASRRRVSPEYIVYIKRGAMAGAFCCTATCRARRSFACGPPWRPLLAHTR